MKQEPVRGDPNQGICISLERVEDLSDCPEMAFQWKCSCWSTTDEFLLEWNINVPTELQDQIPNGGSLSVSQLGFFKNKDMVYVLVAWTRKYVWVYCHDIKSFTEMYSQGINISVEPRMYDLELQEDLDLEGSIESIEEEKHSLSLAIKTGDGEFQFVLSTSNLKLHTLRLTVSGEIAQVLGISISSNWWNIATYNEHSSEAEHLASDSIIFSEETETGSQSKSRLKSIMGILKSAWNTSERTPRPELGEALLTEEGDPSEDHSRRSVGRREEVHRLRTPFERMKGLRKLKKSEYCEDVLILSFPSVYIKWSVSFMCFITAENLSVSSNGKRMKTLLLFRHDSFGVVELCWTLNFCQIDDHYPSNLVAIPCCEKNDNFRSSENSKSTMSVHLTIFPGGSNKFGLFFVYKSNKSLKLLQLVPASSLLLVAEEAKNPLICWTRKPSSNASLLHEVVNTYSFGNCSSDGGCHNDREVQQFFAEIGCLEQSIPVLTDSEAQDTFHSWKSSPQHKAGHNCILSTNKHIFILYITGNGHTLICSNILDHSNQPNKIYFATYSQNTLYLLVNYQDVPLKIDLSSPSNNSLQEHFNSASCMENDTNNENGGNSNGEFNQLVAKYRGLRNGELSRGDVIFDNLSSESIINYLEKIHKQIASDFESTELKGPSSPINTIKLVKTLSLIGQNLNNRTLPGSLETLDEETILLWGKCSLLLDLDYWRKLESMDNWIELSSGTCFDQITSKFPNLQSHLVNHLDATSVINYN